jgi:hypothetical protein
MNLTDVKNVALEEGFDGSYVCPVNMHVLVRVDDLDESYVALLCVTPDGFVKEDEIIHNTDGSVIARTPDELRAWLNAKLAAS